MRFQYGSLIADRSVDQRFRAIYCHEDGDEEHSDHNYYAFIFYELYPDRTPKPNALVVTIHDDWYQNFLLLANPSSDFIVLDFAAILCFTPMNPCAVPAALTMSRFTKILKIHPLATSSWQKPQ